MMPDHNPRTVPAALKGEADPESLAWLVSSSRRMRLFWPLLATTAPGGPGTRAHRGFSVPARAVSVVSGMAEYGD